MTHCFSYYEGKPLERIQQKEYIIYALHGNSLGILKMQWYVMKKITFILPSVVPNENVMYT
mgnify:CR=1 FL=1